MFSVSKTDEPEEQELNSLEKVCVSPQRATLQIAAQ